MLIRVFQIMAVVLCGVAVFLWYRENSDWAFASLVAGICMAFISLRFQAKERVSEADAAREAEFTARENDGTYDDVAEQDEETRIDQ